MKSSCRSPIHPFAACLLVAGFGLAASGCVGPEVDPEVDAETGSTHALITVDRRAIGEETQAAALAGFVQVPAGTDPGAVLALAGWTLVVPETGTCMKLNSERDHETPLAPLRQVELLEVGDVIIQASGGETRLAPRAFTGTDVLTGVLYTTRDPSAEPLPPGALYSIRTSGGALPPLEFEQRAPAQPAHVMIGGVALEEVETVTLGKPIDLTWGVGSRHDLFYVDLASDDGLHATRCAFRDEDGVGSVSEGAFTQSGPGTLSVHRLRSLGIEGSGIQGEIRFDLEQLVEVTFEQ